MAAHPPLQKQNLHASCVLVDDAGILIRGASGSGKSSLALALIDLASIHKRFARLIADDRTLVGAVHGRLLASPQPAIAGLIERRGLGLTPLQHEPRGVIRLVVDCLAEEPERMPEPETLITEICGVTLPRLTIHGRVSDAPMVLAALDLFRA